MMSFGRDNQQTYLQAVSLMIVARVTQALDMSDDKCFHGHNLEIWQV